jgi:hypothetical protein
MEKSGPDFFFLKFTEPVQIYLLTCQVSFAHCSSNSERAQ